MDRNRGPTLAIIGAIVLVIGLSPRAALCPGSARCRATCGSACGCTYRSPRWSWSPSWWRCRCRSSGVDQQSRR